MLLEVFYWVLNMSIIGTLMGGIVLAARKVKHLPCFFVYLLWFVPLVRFWIPVGITGKFSVMTLLSKVAAKTIVVYRFENLPLISASNVVKTANEYFPLAFFSKKIEFVFQVFSLIWLSGVCLLFAAMLLLYWHNKLETREGVHLWDNVFESEKASAPAVYGVFRSKIIVPVGLSEKELTYVLLHEDTHLRRRDNLSRLLALVTVCLHWFNPFVWLLLKRFFEDMELACDAKVLSKLSPDEKKGYALSLLRFAAERNLLISAFGGAKVKTRVQNILSYKKISLTASVCFALLFIAIAIALLTNAQV